MTGQISSAIIQLNTVLSLVIGVLMISEGAMTVGALVAAVMLSGRGVSPLIALTNNLVRAASLREPLNLAAKLVALPPEEAGDTQRSAIKLRGDVALSGVTFRYAQSSAPSLKDLTIAIAAGEKVGIIGRIGCGKSTFVKMIPRLHLPETGGILIDGHDVRQYDPELLRRQVSYMPQDCDLFDSNIRDNIIKGLESVDEALFDMAVTVSGVKDIVAAHPAGYDLKVGKFGRRLSGGERQAVCLARALVRPAPILVLDEPTSAMDGQMERAVIERMRGVIGTKTLIAATHRTPMLSLVDRVIWLDNGKVIADGPTKDVIAHAAKLT
jgi:ATP-binding cassette subfamily C protein LapB